MNFNKKTYRSAGLFLLILLSVNGIAKHTDHTHSFIDRDNISVDGGLALLLALGAAYGIKKLRDFHKAEKNKKISG